MSTEMMTRTHSLEDSGNPLIGEIFRDLRSVDLQRDRETFMRAMRLLGTIMGYEIAGTLGTRPMTVATSLGERRLETIGDWPVMAVILRAAIPLWDGMCQVFRQSDTSIVGAARREGSRGDGMKMEVDFSYEALVPSAGRTVIAIDPMLATGSTAIGFHRILVERGQTPARFIFAAAVAYRGAVERLEEEIPGVEIFVGAIDDELDDRGYIVPGLGDAGDLAFGTKL